MGGHGVRDSKRMHYSTQQGRPNVTHGNPSPNRYHPIETPPADSQAAQQLVAQRLGLGNGAQATVIDLLCIQLYTVSRELEALLDDGGQLTDATALFAYGTARL